MPTRTMTRTMIAVATRLVSVILSVALLLVTLLVPPLAGKTKANPSAAGNALEIKSSLADAIKAVEEVASDPILYGTYVYEHDKTLMGARERETSSAFGKDKPAGTVFYKVIDDVVAPRYFKDTEDSGTITVRYVVREPTPSTVSLRIDAVFITRQVAHASQGAVETAEFGQVQQRLDRIQARAREEEEERKAEAAGSVRTGSPTSAATTAPTVVEYQTSELPGESASQPASLPAGLPAVDPGKAPIQAPTPAPMAHSEAATAAPAGSVSELEQRVTRLRRQVEAVVKAPGAELRSAPFHTAKTIETVPANAEVAIVILTTYWYGVQTTNGHSGWILRSQLESLP